MYEARSFYSERFKEVSQQRTVLADDGKNMFLSP
jgi:hypothetical protein